MIEIVFVRSGVGSPTVGEMDGDYSYNSKRNILEWHLAVINDENSTGSMEFTISGQPDDFFPINVSFYSTKTMCDIQVLSFVHFLFGWSGHEVHKKKQTNNQNINTKQ